MTLLAATNTALAALAAIATARDGDYLTLDADGNLALPPEGEYLVLWTITSTPRHEWGITKEHAATFQVDAWATEGGRAKQLAALAESTLTALRFIPGTLRRRGRDAGRVGYAQDFQKGY